MTRSAQTAPAPLTIAQAAERAGVSRDTIRRRIADGTLRASRVGPKLIRIDAADVDALSRPIPTVQAAAGPSRDWRSTPPDTPSAFTVCASRCDDSAGGGPGEG